MASLIGNKSQKEKQYSTDETGMLKDAKLYAKRDFSQMLELISMLGFEVEEQTVAETLIRLKYNHIEKARTKRVTWFD